MVIGICDNCGVSTDLTICDDCGQAFCDECIRQSADGHWLCDYCYDEREQVEQ